MLKKTVVVLIVLFAGFVVTADSCSGTSSQQDQAQARAANRQGYVPKNDVEFKNYNKRQEVADDPTTILWCTTAFANPSGPMITVPVVGKLTSGNKRPWPNSQVRYQDSYSPELPGPDGMYGTSGEYRYGFQPNNVYVDFYNMETFCTTEPTVFQRQSTKIVMGSDPKLLQAQKEAQAALKAGDAAKANQILSQALQP